MKRLKLTWLAVLLAILASNAAAQDFKLEQTTYRAIEDVVYGHKDGLALTYDVLTPEAKAKNLGVIILSSGSWRSKKSLPAEENLLRKQHWVQGLLGGGYTVFVVRHGSTPRFYVPEMIEDVKRAVRFVRLHARDYNIDPQRIGLVGGSSGGHLSLMAALTADDGKSESKDEVERVSCRVQALMAWFPPTDMFNWGAANGYKTIQLARPSLFTDIFGKISDLEAQLKSISPINFVTTAAPPLFLVHGDADKTVPLQQSEILKAKYEELKRPVKLIVKPGGPHTFWPGIEQNYPAIWAWFDEHLKSEK